MSDADPDPERQTVELLRSMNEKLDRIAASVEGQPTQPTGGQPDDEAVTRDGEPVREKSVLDAEETAETLQAAFDETTDGLETAVGPNGRIWINKTPDAPDYTFGAFLRDPEQVDYLPDEESPGEYYKNAITPDKVEEYISEVLE